MSAQIAMIVLPLAVAAIWAFTLAAVSAANEMATTLSVAGPRPVGVRGFGPPPAHEAAPSRLAHQ